MGQADVNVNLWLKDTKRFADLFNAILFQGKSRNPAGEPLPQPGDNRSQSSGHSGEKCCKKQYRDIIMNWQDQALLMLLAVGITDCHSLRCTVESNAL